jgi:urea transport system ATP-binding protein
MLNVNNLNQYYGGSHILRNVSFTAEAGKVTAVLGRNGVGKSTLLKSLMGLLPTRGGSIEFAGRDLTRAASHQRVKAGIGYVPQGREIFPRLTVQENLLMGLAACPGRTPVPERIFEMFPVLRQMLRRRGGDLSGGQQQQLAIGRALAMGPKLLILDEPTRKASSRRSSRTSNVPCARSPLAAKWPSCSSNSIMILPARSPTSTW